MKRRFESVYADYQRNDRAWSRASEARLQKPGGQARYIDRADELHSEMAEAKIATKADVRTALAYVARNPGDLAAPRILRRAMAAL